jgi:hypothetical protein
MDASTLQGIRRNSSSDGGALIPLGNRARPESRRILYAMHTPLVVRRSAQPVLVSQVVAVDRHSCGRRVVQLDCRLDRLPFIWSRAHLVSRTSHARNVLWLVVRRPSRIDMVDTDDVLAIRLPADLHMGDLLEIPGRSSVAADARVADFS